MLLLRFNMYLIYLGVNNVHIGIHRAGYTNADFDPRDDHPSLTLASPMPRLTIVQEATSLTIFNPNYMMNIPETHLERLGIYQTPLYETNLARRACACFLVTIYDHPYPSWILALPPGLGSTAGT
jgi:hypothetical protein